MNQGWLNPGANYVITRVGLDELLCLVTDTYGDVAVVCVIPDDGDPYGGTVPITELRPATELEIYEHGEARLKRQRLGEGYGSNSHLTMWDLMTERDRAYWRSLRPSEES